MLFYFTGTGNSLYVAKRLEHQPISIPQVMHREDLTFSDDRIGIVAPIYGHEVPAMVQEFLEKATFQTPYFYMILTYGNRAGPGTVCPLRHSRPLHQPRPHGGQLAARL